MNIVSIVDESSASACLAKVHSIVESSRSDVKSRLYFHFLLMGQLSEEQWLHAVRCLNINAEAKRWRGLPEHLIGALSGLQFNTEIIMARLYFLEYFPGMHENVESKYLYLDNDIVVTCDLSDLFDSELLINSAVGATTMQTHATTTASVSAHHAHTGNKLQDLVKAAISSPKGVAKAPPAAVAFVYDEHPMNRVYVQTHFNHSHPRVKAFIHGVNHELFLNGGVALVSTEQWQRQHVTHRAEILLQENNFETDKNQPVIWTDSAGDQGLFYVLFQGVHTARLHPRFNMRRLPKKTVHMLSEGMTGIVHFAGSTFGDMELLCREPLKYPIFISGAVPLFLSVTQSYNMKCQANDQHFKFKPVCAEAVQELAVHLKANSLSVSYNPGLGSFIWPPAMPLKSAQ